MKEPTLEKKFTLDRTLQLLKQFCLGELQGMLVVLANDGPIPQEVSHKYTLFAQTLKSEVGSIYTSPEVGVDVDKALALLLKTLPDDPNCYDEKMIDKILAISALLERKPLLFGKKSASGRYGSYLYQILVGVNNKLAELNKANIVVPKEKSEDERIAYIKIQLLITELNDYKSYLGARKNIPEQNDKHDSASTTIADEELEDPAGVEDKAATKNKLIVKKLDIINELLKTLDDAQQNPCIKLIVFSNAFKEKQEILLKNSDNIAKRILFTIANILTFGLVSKFNGYSFWYDSRALNLQLNLQKIAEGISQGEVPQAGANNGQLELAEMKGSL